jgi:type VI secretion system protein VasD
LRALFKLIVFAGCVATLSGCGTVGEVVSSGLEKLGLKAPTTLDEAKAAKAAIPIDKDVTLRIHAGDALNVDPAARSLSVVVRVYRLKSADAFVNSPLAAFKDADSEKTAFGNDLISAREVVLTPRQKYEVVEALGPDVKYLAVVGMFRAPSQGRWKFVFDKDGASKSGITLGAHACAFSVSAGNPHAVAPELTRLTGVRCG